MNPSLLLIFIFLILTALAIITTSVNAQQEDNDDIIKRMNQNQEEDQNNNYASYDAVDYHDRHMKEASDEEQRHAFEYNDDQLRQQQQQFQEDDELVKMGIIEKDNQEKEDDFVKVIAKDEGGDDGSGDLPPPQTLPPASSSASSSSDDKYLARIIVTFEASKLQDPIIQMEVSFRDESTKQRAEAELATNPSYINELHAQQQDLLTKMQEAQNFQTNVVAVAQRAQENIFKFAPDDFFVGNANNNAEVKNEDFGSAAVEENNNINDNTKTDKDYDTLLQKKLEQMKELEEQPGKKKTITMTFVILDQDLWTFEMVGEPTFTGTNSQATGVEGPVFSDEESSVVDLVDDEEIVTNANDDDREQQREEVKRQKESVTPVSFQELENEIQDDLDGKLVRNTKQFDEKKNYDFYGVEETKTEDNRVLLSPSFGKENPNPVKSDEKEEEVQDDSIINNNREGRSSSSSDQQRLKLEAEHIAKLIEEDRLREQAANKAKLEITDRDLCEAIFRSAFTDDEIALEEQRLIAERTPFEVFSQIASSSPVSTIKKFQNILFSTTSSASGDDSSPLLFCGSRFENYLTVLKLEVAEPFSSSATNSSSSHFFKLSPRQEKELQSILQHNKIDEENVFDLVSAIRASILLASSTTFSSSSLTPLQKSETTLLSQMKAISFHSKLEKLIIMANKKNNNNDQITVVLDDGFDTTIHMFPLQRTQAMKEKLHDHSRHLGQLRSRMQHQQDQARQQQKQQNKRKSSSSGQTKSSGLSEKTSSFFHKALDRMTRSLFEITGWKMFNPAAKVDFTAAALINSDDEQDPENVVASLHGRDYNDDQQQRKDIEERIKRSSSSSISPFSRNDNEDNNNNNNRAAVGPLSKTETQIQRTFALSALQEIHRSHSTTAGSLHSLRIQSQPFTSEVLSPLLETRFEMPYESLVSIGRIFLNFVSNTNNNNKFNNNSSSLLDSTAMLSELFMEEVASSFAEKQHDWNHLINEWGYQIDDLIKDDEKENQEEGKSLLMKKSFILISLQCLTEALNLRRDAFGNNNNNNNNNNKENHNNNFAPLTSSEALFHLGLIFHQYPEVARSFANHIDDNDNDDRFMCLNIQNLKHLLIQMKDVMTLETNQKKKDHQEEEQERKEHDADLDDDSVPLRYFYLAARGNHPSAMFNLAQLLLLRSRSSEKNDLPSFLSKNTKSWSFLRDDLEGRDISSSSKSSPFENQIDLKLISFALLQRSARLGNSFAKKALLDTTFAARTKIFSSSATTVEQEIDLKASYQRLFGNSAVTDLVATEKKHLAQILLPSSRTIKNSLDSHLSVNSPRRASTILSAMSDNEEFLYKKKSKKNKNKNRKNIHSIHNNFHPPRQHELREYAAIVLNDFVVPVNWKSPSAMTSLRNDIRSSVFVHHHQQQQVDEKKTTSEEKSTSQSSSSKIVNPKDDRGLFMQYEASSKVRIQNEMAEKKALEIQEEDRKQNKLGFLRWFISTFITYYPSLLLQYLTESFLSITFNIFDWIFEKLVIHFSTTTTAVIGSSSAASSSLSSSGSSILLDLGYTDQHLLVSPLQLDLHTGKAASSFWGNGARQFPRRRWDAFNLAKLSLSKNETAFFRNRSNNNVHPEDLIKNLVSSSTGGVHQISSSFSENIDYRQILSNTTRLVFKRPHRLSARELNPETGKKEEVQVPYSASAMRESFGSANEIFFGTVEEGDERDEFPHFDLFALTGSSVEYWVMMNRDSNNLSSSVDLLTSIFKNNFQEEEESEDMDMIKIRKTLRTLAGFDLLKTATVFAPSFNFQAPADLAAGYLSRVEEIEKQQHGSSTRSNNIINNKNKLSLEYFSQTQKEEAKSIIDHANFGFDIATMFHDFLERGQTSLFHQQRPLDRVWPHKTPLMTRTIFQSIGKLKQQQEKEVIHSSPSGSLSSSSSSSSSNVITTKTVVEIENLLRCGGFAQTLDVRMAADPDCLMKLAENIIFPITASPSSSATSNGKKNESIQLVVDLFEAVSTLLSESKDSCVVDLLSLSTKKSAITTCPSLRSLPFIEAFFHRHSRHESKNTPHIFFSKLLRQTRNRFSPLHTTASSMFETNNKQQHSEDTNNFSELQKALLYKHLSFAELTAFRWYAAESLLLSSFVLAEEQFYVSRARCQPLDVWQTAPKELLLPSSASSRSNISSSSQPKRHRQQRATKMKTHQRTGKNNKNNRGTSSQQVKDENELKENHQTSGSAVLRPNGEEFADAHQQQQKAEAENDKELIASGEGVQNNNHEEVTKKLESLNKMKELLSKLIDGAVVGGEQENIAARRELFGGDYDNFAAKNNLDNNNNKNNRDDAGGGNFDPHSIDFTDPTKQKMTEDELNALLTELGLAQEEYIKNDADALKGDLEKSLLFGEADDDDGGEYIDDDGNVIKLPSDDDDDEKEKPNSKEDTKQDEKQQGHEENDDDNDDEEEPTARSMAESSGGRNNHKHLAATSYPKLSTLVDRVVSFSFSSSRELTPRIGSFMRWMKFLYQTRKDKQFENHEELIKIATQRSLPRLMIISQEEDNISNDNEDVDEQYALRPNAALTDKAVRFVERTKHQNEILILRTLLYEKGIANEDGFFLMKRAENEELFKYDSSYSFALKMLEERQRLF